MSFNQVIQRLDTVRKHIDEGAEAALNDAALEVLQRAQAIIRAEAYDTGALHESGDIIDPPISQTATRQVLSRTVVFGGATRAGATKNAPSGIVRYAAVVHEVGTGGRGPAVRFLIRAIQETQSKILGKFRKAFTRIVR